MCFKKVYLVKLSAIKKKCSSSWTLKRHLKYHFIFLLIHILIKLSLQKQWDIQGHVIHIISDQHLKFHSECHSQYPQSLPGPPNRPLYSSRLRSKMKYRRARVPWSVFIAAMCKACRKKLLSTQFFIWGTQGRLQIG